MTASAEIRQRIDDVVTNWQARIPKELAEHDLPGLTIGVCTADDVVWSAGFGTRCHRANAPMRPRTRFSVQSTSKLVTATLVFLAVQDDRVDLDEPIVTYLPEFRVHSVFDDDPGRLITLRHLLSHTAGFTHERPSGRTTTRARTTSKTIAEASSTPGCGSRPDIITATRTSGSISPD